MYVSSGQWIQILTPFQFDDLRRNFILNPQNVGYIHRCKVTTNSSLKGLRIKPFKNCALKRATDDQLLKLTAYLIAIAELSDFSALDHKACIQHWMV